MIRILLALLVAAPAIEAAPAVAAATPAVVRVDLVTADGTIKLALDAAKAPITTANFLRYVDEKRFDGTVFYRASKVGQGFGLIQAGTRNDYRRTLPPIAHEPTSKTGLSHVSGAIAMAREAPGSAAGDFFIDVGAMPSMNAHPGAKGDNKGYAVFGHVVGGMAVVKHILASPTIKTGSGAMKGQMLSNPVRILSARRAGA